MSDETAAVPRDDPLPGSLAQFAREFASEDACARLLRRWKYPGGFRCPKCGHQTARYLPSRKLDECQECGHQVSLTAGTAFHGTRKPLRLWFLALFLFASSNRGISALELQRQLGLGSYQTAWAWLHKMRSALGERTLGLLQGTVEVDETYIGGVEEGNGKRGRNNDRKAVAAAAVEALRTRKGFGRVRLAVLEDASSVSLTDFVEQFVDPRCYVVTDKWNGYNDLGPEGYRHRAINLSASPRKAHEELPGVHRVFSLLDRLLLGTYQGAVSRKHLQAYADEFEFRFNRRRSKSRGLVFQRLLSCCIQTKPPPYWEIVGRSEPHIPLAAA